MGQTALGQPIDTMPSVNTWEINTWEEQGMALAESWEHHSTEEALPLGQWGQKG